MLDRTESTKDVTLHTLYLHHEKLPSVIELNKCGLHTELNDLPLFCAIAGHTMEKRLLTQAQSSLACPTSPQFTLVEFTVKQLTLPPVSIHLNDEHLEKYDIFMADKTKKSLREYLYHESSIDNSPIKGRLNAEQQQYMTRLLLRLGQHQHIKLYRFTTLLQNMGDQHILVHGLPFRHWNQIISASCPYNPDVKVTLEPPSTTMKNAPVRTTHITYPKLPA